VLLLDFESTKSIYEILDLPQDVDVKKLRKAWQKHEGRFRPKAERGDKAAERKVEELLSLKEKFWNPEQKLEYDESLQSQGGGLKLGEPTPDHFLSSQALLRAIRRRFEVHQLGFESTRSIYEVLDLPPDIPLKKLRKAWQKLEGQYRPKAERGDKAAEQMVIELLVLKEKFWHPEQRREYDESLRSQQEDLDLYGLLGLETPTSIQRPPTPPPHLSSEAGAEPLGFVPPPPVPKLTGIEDLEPGELRPIEADFPWTLSFSAEAMTRITAAVQRRDDIYTILGIHPGSSQDELCDAWTQVEGQFARADPDDFPLAGAVVYHLHRTRERIWTPEDRAEYDREVLRR